jgi:hypothetical protein
MHHHLSSSSRFSLYPSCFVGFYFLVKKWGKRGPHPYNLSRLRSKRDRGKIGKKKRGDDASTERSRYISRRHDKRDELGKCSKTTGYKDEALFFPISLLKSKTPDQSSFSRQRSLVDKEG